MAFHPYIDIQSISKSFGATHALTKVNLALERGEIHGLLGENGAGKTTLMKVLSGIVVPEEGSVSIAGTDLAFGNAPQCRRAGVSIAYQELSSPMNVSVATKINWPSLPRGRSGLVSRRRLRASTNAILREYDLDGIGPDATMSQLTLAQRQQIEIVTAMSKKPRLLILDEPTAALPDTDWLFNRIHQFGDAGTTVIYISHKMSEIESICDRGTVLRAGEVVGEFSRGSHTQDELVTLMVGREITQRTAKTAYTPKAGSKPTLSVNKLAQNSDANPISMTIQPGEIVGLAGLQGQGEKTLLYTISNKIRHPSQSVTIKQGNAETDVFLVPEERKTEALFLRHNATYNMLVSSIAKFATLGFVHSKQENEQAKTVSQSVNLAPAALGTPIEHLSGGNQQKVVLARALAADPACLVLFDPTRGVDPATKFEMYDVINDFAGKGRSVFIYSTEIPELIRLCNRVYVIREDSIVGEFAGEQLKESNIVPSMLGWSNSEEENGNHADIR
jgi:ribose transport system ATP-binding protein